MLINRLKVFDNLKYKIVIYKLIVEKSINQSTLKFHQGTQLRHWHPIQ